ncbi:MAG: LLM class flavin-dependent oxidoreductase [Alphaproteobacteria bacterium]|nr:LLM class flavin-dependent oxidoreductase [Alphaproteobacteria bacterium]
MKVWHFSEMAYHPGWDQLGHSLRNSIPSRVADPKIVADLLNRYLDEWALCDELGINIMVNEHHASATCLDAVCTVPLAILARETKKVRLLCLGMPIANRYDAVRVAEEYSMIDVISRGRVEMGFVKGSPLEIAPANSSPVDLMERFWEAHDLILKAMTTQDGPFNWEGKFFHYRQVNVWPRPYQAPHPPVWITCGSQGTATVVAEKGYVIGVLNTGYTRTPGIFNAYRKRAAELGRAAAPDRFAYMALIGVGATKEEGYRRAHQIADYSRTTPRANGWDFDPPGYNPLPLSTKIMASAAAKGPGVSVFPVERRDGTRVDVTKATVDEFIDAGLVFAGTPDMVYDQMKEFYDHVGGFGHLLMMGQGGYISHAETVANLKLFSKEVLPRLSDLG